MDFLNRNSLVQIARYLSLLSVPVFVLFIEFYFSDPILHKGLHLSDFSSLFLLLSSFSSSSSSSSPPLLLLSPSFLFRPLTSAVSLFVFLLPFHTSPQPQRDIHPL
ncbi:MAG: hypothetical protein JOS17DRAFT_485965 [Linnemannia elongata]|nr:MAG: hypothetical protein JOS17DRAFT_485965 [Linnemannia elongata]